MRTKAIILKKQNTNEYDQLVTCYTEEFGKVAAVARSVLKPSSIQAMHLDVFNLVDFELINGRGTPIITGAQAEKTYINLKNNLASLAIAYFFAETIDKLAFEYQKDKELWNFLLTLVGELNENSNSGLDFLKNKQIQFLNILGCAPNLSKCTFCYKTDPVNLIAYHIEAKGVVCKDCFLNGSGGIVIKDKDWLSRHVLSSIFESLVERRLYSLGNSLGNWSNEFS